MNEKEKIKKFWNQKEDELKSKLIIVSAAEYKSGYNNITGSIHGLLYLIENGFYFENFESRNFMTELIFREKYFEKINIHLQIENIINVCDYKGNKEKQKLNIATKIMRFIFPPPRKLKITYKTELNSTATVTFITLEEPLKICEEYYSLRSNKG